MWRCEAGRRHKVNFWVGGRERNSLSLIAFWATARSIDQTGCSLSTCLSMALDLINEHQEKDTIEFMKYLVLRYCLLKNTLA